MKSGFVIGVVLIVLGVIALGHQWFTYTKQDTLIDLGPIHATEEHQHTVLIPPIVGVACIIGGVVLVVFGARKS